MHIFLIFEISCKDTLKTYFQKCYRLFYTATLSIKSNKVEVILSILNLNLCSCPVLVMVLCSF